MLLFWIFPAGAAAQSQLAENNYRGHEGLPRLRIERAFVYVPQEGWMYAHHPHITRFGNQWIAMWSNGMKDEDASGQRVLYAVSKDFFNWTEPMVLSVPPRFQGNGRHVLTAAGFHQYRDTLVAYYGSYSPKRTHTRLFARWTTDGRVWSDAIDLHIPVNPNIGPQATSTGRLIISGNFTMPYTDDPSGLRGWQMTSFYPDSLFREDNPATFYAPAEKLNLPPLCEASFFETAGGALRALLRVTGKGWKGRLWQTESSDNGSTWSVPVETPFTDNDSKFHFGKLPDGRFYYVGIPDTVHHYLRNPMVLSLSADGRNFNRHFIIADSEYKLKQEGLWKGGQYGYPHTFIHDNRMYVIVSRQKEAVEVLRFSLQQLPKQ